MPDEVNPIRPTDDEARALAKDLLRGAHFAALAVIDPATGGPFVSRVALGLAPDGMPVTLVSTLSHHTRALMVDPRASVLVGEPGPKGDPLTHPRLTIQATATFVARDAAAHGTIRAKYLVDHPKAKLYADFGDFSFVLLRPSGAAMNGGFGKAYMLTPEDLGMA